MDWFQAQKAKRDELAAVLRDKYAEGMLPLAISNKVFSVAWEQGHASGDHEVESLYIEFVDLAAHAYLAGKNDKD